MKHQRIRWLLLLLMVTITSFAQNHVINLEDNEDGSWTLKNMPNDDVRLVVEYEDPQSIDLKDNGDGTWTLENSPCYDTELVVEYDIRLKSSKDNSYVISSSVENHADVTLGGITLEADKWNTLCLPFDLTAEQIAQSPLAGATIRTYDSYTNDGTTLTIYFAESTAIEAGKPFAVKFTGSNIENPMFESVTISDATANVVKGDATFTGVYAPVTLTAGDTKKLFLDDKDLFYPTEDITVNAFRAYFDLTTDVPTSPDSHIIVDFGDYLIGDVNNDKAVDISDVVALVNIILNGSSDYQAEADVNNDEGIDISDVVALVNIILGQ